MIKVAATSTDVRKEKIMNMLHRIAHNQSPTLQQFGIQIGTGFTNVPARILPAPKLEYNNSKIVQPSKGQWRSDNFQFLQPMAMTRYAVLVLDRYDQTSAVRKFCETVSSCSTRSDKVSFNQIIKSIPFLAYRSTILPVSMEWPLTRNTTPIGWIHFPEP